MESHKYEYIEWANERLSELKVGQKAKVLKINEQNKAIRRHLLDMGITKGTEILIKKVAPMGDPVDIELRGYELCIRKEEMKNIDVKII